LEICAQSALETRGVVINLAPDNFENTFVGRSKSPAKPYRIPNAQSIGNPALARFDTTPMVGRKRPGIDHRSIGSLHLQHRIPQ
jgi:hypothetical protein